MSAKAVRRCTGATARKQEVRLYLWSGYPRFRGPDLRYTVRPMSILVDGATKVICQGITGSAGAFHTKGCLDYGTKMAGGVTPGKGGAKDANGLPIFDTVADAVKATAASATMIFVPPPFAGDAILEAADAGIAVICAITEGIPTQDMIKVKAALRDYPQSVLIGPNCPGVITPGKRLSGEGGDAAAKFAGGCKIGIMPGYIHTAKCDAKSGRAVGIISRSGTLTYEAVWQTSSLGLGQSTCVGIGGDPVKGLNFIELLDLFNRDAQTDGVVMIGEIGGSDETNAGEWIKANMKKPVVAFIAGRTAPKGKRMGHAGAIIGGADDTAQAKMDALRSCGVHVAESPADIGKAMAAALGV
jgi:succinyl-CoA synthetase alpha subunit